MFYPVVDESECTQCKACARICPKLVFDPDKDQVTVVNPIHCTGCESCAAVCPKNALKVEEI